MKSNRLLTFRITLTILLWLLLCIQDELLSVIGNAGTPNSITSVDIALDIVENVDFENVTVSTGLYII